MHQLQSLYIQLENLQRVLKDIEQQKGKEHELGKIISQIQEVEKLIVKQLARGN